MPDGAGDSGDSDPRANNASGLLLPALAAVLPAGQPLAVLSGQFRGGGGVRPARRRHPGLRGCNAGHGRG
jgi:hypothetical protein